MIIKFTAFVIVVFYIIGSFAAGSFALSGWSVDVRSTTTGLMSFVLVVGWVLIAVYNIKDD